jgi:hypothetical protein
MQLQSAFQFIKALNALDVDQVVVDALRNPDIVEQVRIQDRAREAWADGRRLVVGAYYQHRNGSFVRRVLALDGEDVRWADQVGAGICFVRVFKTRVSGPL